MGGMVTVKSTFNESSIISEYREYQSTSMSSLENTTRYTRGAMTQYAPGHSEAQCNQWSPWDAVQHYSSAVRHYLHYSLVTPVHLIPSCTVSCSPISNSPGNILATYFHRFYSMTFGRLLNCNFSLILFILESKTSLLSPSFPFYFFISFIKCLGPLKL